MSNVENLINYQFKNGDLLSQIFTRENYAIKERVASFKILELIGSSVLKQFVAKYLSKHTCFYPSFDEKIDGFVPGLPVLYLYSRSFEKMLNELTSDKYLSNRVLEMKIAMNFLKTSIDEKEIRENSTKINAELFKSIIGAVAYDSNYDWDILNNVLSNMLNIDIYVENYDDGVIDYVQLLKYVYKTKCNPEDINFHTSRKNGEWISSVIVETPNGYIMRDGKGETSFIANQNAAKNALRLFAKFYFNENDQNKNI